MVNGGSKRIRICNSPCFLTEHGVWSLLPVVRRLPCVVYRWRLIASVTGKKDVFRRIQL